MLILESKNFWNSLFPLIFLAGTAMSEGAQNTEIAHVGYIEDPKIQEMVTSLGSEYLGEPIQSEDGRRLAKGILTYIGPSLVSNGRFVPPDDFYIPEQQLEIMSRKIFPEEGCRIERLIFAQDDGFIVLLIDATDTPTEEYITKCFMGAVLAALGEEIDGTPIQTLAEMDQHIRSIIN